MGSQGKDLASDLPLALRGSPYSPLRWEPLPRLSGRCVSQCWREERETVNERLSSAADKGSPDALGPAWVLSIPRSVSGQEFGHLN